jgi:GMP reductase
MKQAGSAIEYVCIDVANGYTETFIEFVKVRQTYPQLTIMAGNVVTGDITEELILAGADIVKVGIGRAQSALRAK